MNYQLKIKTMKNKLPLNFPQVVGRGVLLLPYDEEEMKTESGLIIKEAATGDGQERRKPAIAIIKDVGPDCVLTIRDINTGLYRKFQPGDKVGHTPYADSGFMFGSYWYLQLSELDIKVYYPDNEAKPYVKEVPSRKRAAVQKAKNKFL